MNKYTDILEPEKTYYIYNRAVGNEKLYTSDDNYRYFMKRYQDFIYPVAHTFCYCLLLNHFHLLIKIRNKREVVRYLKEKVNHSQTLTGFETLSGLRKQQLISNFFSKQFSNLFNAYTQAFNKQQSRIGSLFNRPFKRRAIDDENYLYKLVHCIHFNPVEASFCADPRDWEYSSYNAIVSDKPGIIRKNDIIEWFDDKENSIYCHKYPPELTGIEKIF
ncbi:MAG: hypothetical protein JXB24_03800 [Bacteroidales bacterium]|nr:hypothetical protein [Bacteroidales bacterium]